MPRNLLWVESQNSQGFGCSECAWVFKSSGPLIGKSLDEMKREYEAQRDMEFAAHICVKRPRASIPGKA